MTDVSKICCCFLDSLDSCWSMLMHVDSQPCQIHSGRSVSQQDNDRGVREEAKKAVAVLSRRRSGPKLTNQVTNPRTHPMDPTWLFRWVPSWVHAFSLRFLCSVSDFLCYPLQFLCVFFVFSMHFLCPFSNPNLPKKSGSKWHFLMVGEWFEIHVQCAYCHTDLTARRQALLVASVFPFRLSMCSRQCRTSPPCSA